MLSGVEPSSEQARAFPKNGAHWIWETCALPHLKHLRFLAEVLGELTMQQIALAASRLLEYAFGLRPRPNTPGTLRILKTYAPPRLVHLHFRQKRRADWLCVSPHLSLANWLTTLSACGLEHIHPDTHRVRKSSAPLLSLQVGFATRPHCKTFLILPG